METHLHSHCVTFTLHYTTCCCLLYARRFFSSCPERYYITALLLGLLCWQNPVLAALSSGLLHNSATDAQLLAADVTQVIGLQLMWFSWIALMDGQRFTKQARHRAQNPTDNSNPNGFSNGFANGNVANGCTTALACRVQNLQHHHPASDFFIDFVLLKALYALLALCVGLCLCALRHPGAVPSSVQAGVAALLLRLGIDAQQAYQGQYSVLCIFNTSMMHACGIYAVQMCIYLSTTASKQQR
jgi:hypothetical protein